MAKARIDQCPCESGEPGWLEHDARNIPIGYMCSHCRQEKLEKYRPDVLHNPNYIVPEPIEPE